MARFTFNSWEEAKAATVATPIVRGATANIIKTFLLIIFSPFHVIHVRIPKK